jgi:3-methyladenine DNA glycosylase/8-oxoguanine DNA glycosylase
MSSTLTTTLLAADRHRVVYDVARVAVHDGGRTGAISMRVRAGLLRRAEPGPAGPLVLEARTDGEGVAVEVWGSARTPADVVERALEDAVGWAGLRDDPSQLREAVAGHPRARALARSVGEVRLSRMPRVGEALGRTVLAQLVQSAEAHRSIRQVARRAGEIAPHGLRTWPTAAQVRAMPDWALRACGVSLRCATALHAGARHDLRLAEAVGDWPVLDQRLNALPGVGVWTRGEVRRLMGDPDGLSVGDYNLPSWVGAALGDGTRSAWHRNWTDDDMLALLAPFPGQRGRVTRLCELAIFEGHVRRPPRRGARAALSQHRYW